MTAPAATAGSGAPGPDPARVRALLDWVAAALTVALALAWAWLQQRPPLHLLLTALAGVGVLVALRHGRAPIRRAARALALALAVVWLAGFYQGRHGEAAAGRLAAVPAGRALLSASVMLALAPSVLRAAAQRRRPVLPALAGAAALLVAADLYFVPDWFGEFQRLRYHPFLTLDAPGTYKYAHAQERQVRDGTNQVLFAQRKPAGVVRIVLLGASTMMGAANPDGAGPPPRLLHHLRRAQPGRHFEVITLAEPGTLQLHELIQAAVTVPHWSPDLVVSWNGFNEVWYAEEDNRYEGMPAGAAEVEASIEAGPLEAWLYRHSFFGAYLFVRRRAALDTRYGVQDRDVFEPPRYFAYLRREARLLRQEGIRFAYSFCPNVAEKAPRSVDEERYARGFSGLADRVAERRRLSEQILREEGQIPYDVMESLNGAAESLFVDLCHLNDRGADQAARDLAARIPGWLARPVPREGAVSPAP
jgi:hypothetical protein